MIDVTVYNRQGKKVETLKVDEAVFGSKVRYPLLKQAIVMYHNNKRLGTAASKSRGMVAGSTRKIYRQKGTGYARMGTIRSNVRKGGGVSFAKEPRDFSQRMPKKQRRLARDSAILAKLLSDSVVVVDKLEFEKPRTKDFVALLGNLKIDRGCLVAITEPNDNLYKSARNITKVDVMSIADLNAGDICRRQKMLFTKDSFIKMTGKQNDNSKQNTKE
jgi:large subunit ribosomal protein L4